MKVNELDKQGNDHKNTMTNSTNINDGELVISI